MTNILDIFKYEFILRAIISSIFCGICCGIIGSWIVLLNIPFIGIAISHAAFAGSILGILLGINPLFTAAIFCLLTSFIIGPLTLKINLSPNLSMSIIFSVFLGLAFIFLSLIKNNKSEVFNFFWGNILTLSWEMVWIMFILTIILILFVIVYNRKIFIILFSNEIAQSVGIKYKAMFYFILGLCGIVVTLNLNTIGGLLIFSLIVTTPLSAYQLARSVREMYFLSSMFGIISCVLGLVVSYYLNLPSGSTIVLFSIFILVICRLLSFKQGEKVL